MKTLRLLVLSALASFAVVATAAPAAVVEVTDGWIRHLPAGAPSAGYATVHNASAAPVVLTSVSSPDFARVQLHESYTTKEGYARMREVKRLTIAPHGTLRFAPGGYHLMLMDPRRDLAPGATASIVLHFADGASVTAPMLVRPADYIAPAK